MQIHRISVRAETEKCDTIFNLISSKDLFQLNLNTFLCG